MALRKVHPKFNPNTFPDKKGTIRFNNTASFPII
mgnify:CR=1 FL=1